MGMRMGMGMGMGTISIPGAGDLFFFCVGLLNAFLGELCIILTPGARRNFVFATAFSTS